jgi:hypothetical protein
MKALGLSLAIATVFWPAVAVHITIGIIYGAAIGALAAIGTALAIAAFCVAFYRRQHRHDLQPHPPSANELERKRTGRP